MKKLVLIALLGGFTALAADEALPPAETILNHYIEVTGGKAAWEKRKTEVATGTVEIVAQGIKGTLAHYSADPDKSYTVLEIDGIGKIEEGQAGGVAWDNSVIQGPRIKSGEEKSQAIREATFNAPLHWHEIYSKVETVGVDKVDGEDCYKVVMTPADGKPVTVYFQKKSGLEIKTAMKVVSQIGEVDVESTASNYKEFDGVLMPTTVVQNVAGQVLKMTVQNVKVNEDIPASRFEPPAEVKALLNKAQ